MTESPTLVPDGRRARRERNREAVVDAVIDLIVTGSKTPAVEVIAERAGVSVSSVFRYFDGIEDLNDEAIERYFTRYAPLFAVPDIGEGTRDERIGRFVTARLGLYSEIAPIGRLARARASEQPRMAAALERARTVFVDQARRHFAPELATRTDADAEALVALIDAQTSFESWDLHHVVHALSDTRIHEVWTAGLHLLLEDRPAGPPGGVDRP